MSKYKSYTTYESLWNKSFPSHWSVLPMYALAKEKSICGCVDLPLLSVYLDVGVIPFSAKAEKRTNVTSKDLSRYQRVDYGDFVLNNQQAWRGSVGISYDTGIVSPAYIVLSMDDTLNSRYANYLLRSQIMVDQYLINSKSVGSIQRNIYWPTLKRTSVPVPPRSEQDQIVRFLDWKISSINELINIKHGQLNIVKELLNRVFRDISLEHSKRVKIKYLFGLENDFFVPDASELYSKAGMYNRGRGIFLREQCPGNELGDSQFQHIHPDCLMLSGQFAWEDAVYITQEKDSVGIASHRYYLLKPTKDVSVEYLWAYFLSYEGSFNLQRCSHGSAGRNRPLNIKEVLDLELPVPDDLGAVKTLNKLVRDYMRLQVITRKERTNLIDLRTLLIADTVTGKIDVRNITVPEYEFVDEDVDADKESSEDESEENDDFNGVEE